MSGVHRGGGSTCKVGFSEGYHEGHPPGRLWQGVLAATATLLKLLARRRGRRPAAAFTIIVPLLRAAIPAPG